MSLSLDGSNLVLVWHTSDILVRSHRFFGLRSYGVICISLIAIIYLITDHDLDHLLIATALLIAGHMVWYILA